jgi:hypothetical protein
MSENGTGDQGAPASQSVELPPAYTLDPAKVGHVLINLALASVTLGHSRPMHTLQDYCHGPEASFVRDVFTEDTKTLCDRWYGGEDLVREVAVKHVDRALGAE